MCDAFIKPGKHNLFRMGSKVNRTNLRPESIIMRLRLIGFKRRAHSLDNIGMSHGWQGVWPQVEDLKIQVCNISTMLL
jgi:hypothetical protein